MPASGFNVLFNKKDGNNGQRTSSGQPVPTRTPSQRFTRRENDKENVLDSSAGSNPYNEPQVRAYEPSQNARASPKAGSHRMNGYSSAGEAEQKKRRGHYYSGYTNSQSDHEGGRTKSSRYASNPNMDDQQHQINNRQSRQYSQESLYPNGHPHAHNGYERGMRQSGSKSDSEETNRRRRAHNNPHRHSGITNGIATDTEMVAPLDVYRNTMGVAVNGNDEHRQQRRHQNSGQQQRQHRHHRHSQYAYDPSQAEVLLELGPPGGGPVDSTGKPELTLNNEKENGPPVSGGYPPPPHGVYPHMAGYPVPPHVGGPVMPPGGQFIPQQQYYPPHIINQVRHQMMHMHNVSQHLYRPQQQQRQQQQQQQQPLMDLHNPHSNMVSAPRNLQVASNGSQKSPGQSGRSTTSSSKSHKSGAGVVNGGGEMAANYSVSTEL